MMNTGTRKIVNRYHFRLWIMPMNSGWHIHRKHFRKLGYVIFMGRVRVSFTLLSHDHVLFNPITLQVVR